jgi:hypothetical protein
MQSFARLGALVALLSLAACASEKPKPAPQPAPAPPPPPQPAPPPPPPQWEDLPDSPGDWSYRDEGSATSARFGPTGMPPSLIFQCDRARREIRLLRQGIATGNTMTVRTTSGARNLPLSVQPDAVPYVYASLTTSDALLDDIAFSRGHFTIEAPGIAMAVIPSWTEPSRVIEDCRR